MQSGAQRLQKYGTLFALTRLEYNAARELVKAGVVFVSDWLADHPRSKSLPRSFVYKSARYRLEYTTLGRVHIRVNGFPKARFSSGVLAI